MKNFARIAFSIASATFVFISAINIGAAHANDDLKKVAYGEASLSQKEIRSLMNWAVYLSGYQSPAALPDLRSVPHSFMVENACYGQECKVLGWYNDKGIVYVDEKLVRSGTLFSRSLIVHEMIHHLQHLSGNYDSNNCADVAAREAEAYRLQQQYFTENGSLSPLRIHLHHCKPESDSQLTFRTR